MLQFPLDFFEKKNLLRVFVNNVCSRQWIENLSSLFFLVMWWWFRMIKKMCTLSEENFNFSVRRKPVVWLEDDKCLMLFCICFYGCFSFSRIIFKAKSTMEIDVIPRVTCQVFYRIAYNFRGEPTPSSHHHKFSTFYPYQIFKFKILC